MKSLIKPTLAIAALLLIAASQPQAQSTPSTPANHAGHQSSSTSAANTAMADGEVRRIDAEQGKLTLKHGRIENLDMPPMTMVFKAAEPKLLEGLKVGDKIRFAAESRNGALTVTAIEVLK